MGRSDNFVSIGQIAARVIMIHDGSIHILFDHQNCFLCTAENLSALLVDHEALFNKQWLEDEDTWIEVNPTSLTIDLVPGITLAYVKKDKTVVLKHPLLSILLFENLSDDKKSQPFVLNADSCYLKSEDPLFASIRTFLEMGRIMYAVTKSGVFSISDGDSEIISTLQTMADRLPGNFVTALNIARTYPIFKELITCDENTLDRETYTDDLSIAHSWNNTVEESEVDNKLNLLTEYHVTIEVYATLVHRAPSTVRGWASRGELKTAIMVDGKWYIDSREIKVDRRCRSISDDVNPTNNKPKKRRRKRNTDSYADLQLFLKEEGKFGDAINPYIYDYEEYQYYARKHREVNWGRPALIIPVDFDYYSHRYKKTNRELILDNKSPVIPGDEEHIYVIHHVGRKPGGQTPFAILPSSIHSEYHGMFHRAPAPTEDLHDDDFEKEKHEFWKTYLRKMLEYGSFSHAPFIISI